MVFESKNLFKMALIEAWKCLIIEQRLRFHGDHRSWETIREILSTHKRLTIEYNVKEQERIIRYHLNFCSRPEPIHNEIYYRLNLSGVPLGRRYVAVK